MILPEPIQALINAFERLPGIGPKSASRLAFYLLRAPEDVAQELSEALRDLKGKVAFCQQCFNITEAGRILCEICEDPRRKIALAPARCAHSQQRLHPRGEQVVHQQLSACSHERLALDIDDAPWAIGDDRLPPPDLAYAL